MNIVLRHIKISFCLLLFLAARVGYGASNWYVNDASTTGDIYCSAVGNDGTGTGATNHPYLTVAKAVSVASAGDVIYVDAGTYTTNAVTYNDYSIIINKNLTITGAGSSLVTFDATGHTTNYLFSITAGTVTVSGMTITQYKPSGTSGGAIRISGGTVGITSCAFSSCTAGYGHNGGGGIYISGGTPTITSCTFTSCTASANSVSTEGGGAIYSTVATTITSCTFTSNSASYSGGAINICRPSSASGNSIISKCIFTGNSVSTYNGYAFHYYNPASSNTDDFYLENCLFYANNSSSNSGTIYINTSPSGGNSSANRDKIINCSIYATTETPIIESDNNYITISNSIIWNTTSTASISWPSNTCTNTTIAYSAVGSATANSTVNGGNNVTPASLAAVLWKGNSSGSYAYVGAFYLSPTSPAIGVAATTSDATYPSQTTDLNGITRPASPSMGCFEFGGCGSYTVGTYYVGGTVGSTVDGHTVNFGNITAVIDTLKQCSWTGHIVLQLTSTYTSGGYNALETFPIDFTGISTSSSNTLMFEPDASGTGLSITSSNATGTMLFDGQSYVYFNGSPNNANTMDSTNNLAIINTGGGYAIKFVNNAGHDNIEFCNIRAENTATAGGTIIIGAGLSAAITTIRIGQNYIGNVDATHYSANAIFSLATSSSYITTSITVDSNCIFNYTAAATASYGIWIKDYNTAWTISNNRFYNTLNITQTTSYVHSPIFIGGDIGTKPSSPGGGYTISNNRIGYYSSTGKGTYSFTNSGGNGGRFLPIYLNTDASAGTSNITGNYITAISIVNAHTAIDATLPGTFSGIAVMSGAVTIGGSGNSNYIGGATGNDSITYYYTVGVNTWYGIWVNSTNTTPGAFSTTGTKTITYNYIGGMSNKGAASTAYFELDGIFIAGTPTATVTNNVIGSTTTTGSISVGLSNNAGAGASTFYGVNCQATGSISIQTNTIQNVVMYSNNASTTISGSGQAIFYGVYCYNGSIALTAAPSLSSNIIENITVGGGSTSNFYGIYDNPYNGVYTHTISSNTIGGTGAINITIGSASTAYGIYVGSASTDPTYTIQSNNIGGFSIGSGSASGTYSFYGIDVANTGTNAITISSNTIGSTSTAPSIKVGQASTDGTPTTSGIGLFYGIYNVSQGAASINSNVIQNVSTYATTYTPGSSTAQKNYAIYDVPASSTPSATINSNTIEDISILSPYIAPSSYAPSFYFYGVYTSGVGTTTMTTNTIGASSHPITVGGSSTTTGPMYFYGIYASTGGTTIIGNSTGSTLNTIANVTTYGTTAATTDYGIYVSSSSTTTIANNAINSLTLASGNTTGNTTFYGIYTTGSGSGYISTNTIGTSSGTITVGGASSAGALNGFAGIYNSFTSNTASTIKGNTIQYITSYAHPTSSANITYCYGIVDSTYQSTGTQVCSQNTVQNITVASNNTSGTYGQYYFIGVHIARANGYGSFMADSNTIATITMGGSGATTSNNFYGVEFAMFQGCATNTTTAPKMNYNTIQGITLYGGANTNFYGIFNQQLAHVNNNITNNTIGATSATNNDIYEPNMSAGVMIGIYAGGYYVSSGWASSTFTIKNNTIQNLSAGGTAGGATGSTAGTNYFIGGIANGGGPPSGQNPNGSYQADGNYIIKSNNINNLSAMYNGSTGTSPMTVAGMYMIGNPTEFDFEQNRIIGLVNQCAPSKGTYTINGVYGVMAWRGTNTGTIYGAQITLINNLIYLTYPGGSTYNNYMCGIWYDGMEAQNFNIFYNSVHIGGAAAESGGASSTQVNGSYLIGANCLNIYSAISASYINSNIFQNSVQSTNNQSQFLPVYVTTTANLNLSYNYVEAYNTNDFGYWAGLVTKATWLTDFVNDVVELSTGSSPSPISITSPSGSLSSTDLTTVGHGVNIKDTLSGLSYPCRYDIDGVATVAGDSYNRSSGYGHKGCWEAAGTFYWVGGTGSWSNYQSHWATTSGGSTYMSCLPTVNDDVFFDGNSGGGTCTIDVTANCNNLWCGVDGTDNNYTGLFAGTAALNINGTLEYATSSNGYTGSMGTNTYSGTITFSNNSGGAKTDSITSAGQTFHGPVIFNGTSGTWKMMDDATMAAALTMTAGTLTVGAHTLTLGGATTVSPNPATGTIDASNTSATVAFTNTAGFTLPTSLWTSSTINALTMNGTGGITLQEAITVPKALTLTSGNITVGSNILTLGTSSTDISIPTTPTNASHVIAINSTGGVKQFIDDVTGSVTYNFPIGDASYYTPITFKFSAGTLTSASLTAYTIASKIPELKSTVSKYLSRYWGVVAGGTITSPTYEVTYTYNTADVSSPTKLIPIELGNNQLTWNLPTLVTKDGGSSAAPSFTQPPGTTFTKVGTANWTSASYLLDWSSGAYLGTSYTNYFSAADDQAVVLPIELVEFTATPIESDVVLKWETASEINNDYFTIEKTHDGVNYTPVLSGNQPLKVKGAGNSAHSNYYTALDSAPYQGLSYYRLKQTDFDGKYTYSNLVPVEFNKTLDYSFQIYPNPSNGNLMNLAYNAKQGSSMQLYFYDISGKLVHVQTLSNTNPGAQIVNITPAQKLSSGVYHVVGITDTATYHRKIVVE